MSQSYQVKQQVPSFDPHQTDLPRVIVLTDDSEIKGFLSSPPDSPTDPHLIAHRQVREGKRYVGRWVELTVNVKAIRQTVYLK